MREYRKAMQRGRDERIQELRQCGEVVMREYRKAMRRGRHERIQEGNAERS